VGFCANSPTEDVDSARAENDVGFDPDSVFHINSPFAWP
jgi:hypothetical protein